MAEQLVIQASNKLRPQYNKLEELIRKTNKESPRDEDVTALRKLLDEYPELWRGVGSMAKRVLNNIARCYYGKNAYAQELAVRQANDMRDQLGFKDAPPLEKILIEQVLVCYLNPYSLELFAAWKVVESHATEAGLYWDRRLTGAQGRFTRACESLAKVRRLSRPNVQINVAAEGGQQLNVA